MVASQDGDGQGDNTKWEAIGMSMALAVLQ